jgi:hypothetical protein
MQEAKQDGDAASARCATFAPISHCVPARKESRMHFEATARLTATEIQFQREEAIEHLRERYRMPAQVAERIVASSKNIDQACSIAELMR